MNGRYLPNVSNGMEENRANHVSLRLLLPLFLLALAGVGAEAEEESLREEVQRLAAGLAAEEFQEREAACEALRNLGAEAWPYLHGYLADGDLERANRVRMLARSLAILLPQEEERGRELVRQLLERKDEMARAAGLDGLLELGPGGQALLRQVFSAKGSRPVLKMEFTRQVFKLGEKVSGKGRLVNEGEEPFWWSPGSRRLTATIGTVVPFGENRDLYGRCCGGGRRIAVRRGGGYYNPIRAWIAVGKGETAQECPLERTLDQVGRYEVSLVGAPAKASILPRHPRTGKEVALELNAEAGPEAALSLKTTLFALPDPARPDGQSPLRLELALDEPRPAWAPRALLPVRVAIVQRDPVQAVRLEPGLVRFAWYALLDASGSPVQWGSWRSVLEGAAAEDSPLLAPTAVPAGGRAAWLLQVPLPERPGVYSLAAGYQAGNPECMLNGKLDYWAKHGEQDPGVLYISGGEWAGQLEGLSVQPSGKAVP